QPARPEKAEQAVGASCRKASGRPDLFGPKGPGPRQPVVPVARRRPPDRGETAGRLPALLRPRARLFRPGFALGQPEAAGGDDDLAAVHRPATQQPGDEPEDDEDRAHDEVLSP